MSDAQIERARAWGISVEAAVDGGPLIASGEQILRRLDPDGVVPVQMGPISAERIPLVRDNILGEYQVLFEMKTSTGKVLLLGRWLDDGQVVEVVVKTNLDPDHKLFCFETNAWRTWSLGAEGDMGLSQGGVYEGLASIELVGEGKVVLKSLVDEAVQNPQAVEPALAMERLSPTRNLFYMLTRGNEIEHVDASLSDYLQAIKAMQRPLTREQAEQYASREALYRWIDSGNLTLLRNRPEEWVRQFSQRFWTKFQQALRLNEALIVQRVEGGHIVHGHGDTHPRNSYLYLAKEEGYLPRFIDPITLPLRLADGVVVEAPWPFRDKMSEPAFTTCALLAMESRYQPRGDWGIGELGYGELRQRAIDEYPAIFDEDLRGKLWPLFRMYEGALAMVLVDIELRTGLDPDELAWHYAQVAEASLDEVAACYENLRG